MDPDQQLLDGLRELLQQTKALAAVMQNVLGLILELQATPAKVVSPLPKPKAKARAKAAAKSKPKAKKEIIKARRLGGHVGPRLKR